MLNKVILMGRLTRDPEFRQTQSGVPHCKFTIAINRQKQKEGTQEADFIDCDAWRGTAEFVSRYFNKGSMILVEGELRNNNYTDNNGTKHYSMRVLVENVSFCESKNAGAAPPDQGQYPQPAPQQYQQPYAQGQQYAPPPQYQQQYQAPPPQYGAIPPQPGNPYHPQ